jgi:hypothetical protein
MKPLLFAFCSMSMICAFGQNQTADYNRLSAATKNAFSVPKREYTYKIEYTSTPGSTTSSNTSSSSQKSTISGDYSSYQPINANEGRLRKQAEAAARQNARLSAFDAKMKRVDDLIASRGLKRSPEYQPQLVQAAIDGGLTAYEASRFFGNSPEEYRSMLAAKSGQGGSGERYETLKFPKGDVYTGKTLNGEPHGEGTITFARDGLVMKGEFKNGQANGMMTVTAKNYVQTGKFVNGIPVGDHRYDYDDGKVKLVETRNMETGKSTVEYPDKSSFDGLSDENGKYIKGKVLYASGISFDGDFKNGAPYRGVWENKGRVMIGEFGELTSSDIYLKFGYHYDPKTNEQTYGSFTPGMKRIGYSRTVKSNNNVQHEIYGENETIIYVYTQYVSGNLLAVKAKQDGYDYVGTFYNAATNDLDPVIWDKKKGIVEIPANDPLAEKARAYSREVAPAINAGKHEYEAKLKEVEPYIHRYNAEREGVQSSAKTSPAGLPKKTEVPGTTTSVASGTNAASKGAIPYDGGTYTGELNAANQPHGQGKYVAANGDYIYEGSYVNGKGQGKGKMTWKNGEFYEGDCVNGLREGKGKYTMPNGDVYVGEHKEGVWHGKGKLTYANGKVEEGIWNYGEMEPKPVIIGPGKAKFEWNDRTYVGAYVNGKRTGKGKLTTLNGEVYEGDFVDGQRHGKGKLTWESGGGGYYEGEFANNQLIYGKGKVTSFTGDVYTGEFKGGLKHGKGKMIYADGKIEEGNWERGQFKGNN